MTTEENKDVKDFTTFNLPTPLMQALARMRITIPTPVQTMAIPIALEGHDILASAQTGTGKTLAYTIPLAIKLLNNLKSSALILAPTRELAAQVQVAIRQLLGSSINTVLLIGGESIYKQLTQLKSRPRIIIGTPGRINDHLTRGSLRLNETSFLVVDEADRMLDMGFSVQLEQIAQHLPSKRQTMMFSATLPYNILKLSEKFLQNPKRVSIDSVTAAAPNIKQEFVHTSAPNKFTYLIEELEKREGSVIVFVKTKRGADNLTDKLQRLNQSAIAIHGGLNQRQRDRAIRAFRKNENRIMVATDIAARGLDIPHIMHVINYDLPQCPEDYIHRIGRTARAGAEGHSLCLISPEDNSKWKVLHRLINSKDGKYTQSSSSSEPSPSANRNGAKRPPRHQFSQKRKTFSKPRSPRS